MVLSSRKHHLIAVSLLWAILVPAQADKTSPAIPEQSQSPGPAAIVRGTNSDPSKEAVVFEKIVATVVFQPDGTGTRDTAVEMRIQSQAGVQQFAVLAFPYTSSNDTVEVDYVRVRHPDGTVVVTPDYNIQDMTAEVSRNAPMYSDIREKHITVKGLRVGDLLEYLIRYRTLKPQVPGHFWYQQGFTKLFITKDEELEIRVPRDKYVKVASPDLAPKIIEDATQRIYSWKTSNLDLKDRETLLKKTEAPKPSVQITTFRNWEEVGRWYKELQQPELEVTPQIQAKAAELTKGLGGDEEKIRAIYNYVSTRFHYISLSFGIGRYRPHAAEDVLENEYGDCKDKHTLLATLLKAAGYDAWPVLINATSKVDPEVPSPGQFNHALSIVPRGDKLLWLDTTPEVSPFGLLLANLRDKQALVMSSNKPALLMTTPADPPFRSLQTFTSEGKLSVDGTLTAHVEQTLRGDVEVLYRAAFRSVPPAQWQELGQRVCAGEGFGGEVANVTASSPEETDKPFTFSWDYTKKKFGDWPNHQIVMPVPWFGLESAASEEKRPEEPIKIGAPGEMVYKAKIELPPEFAHAYSGKEDLSESFAEYHATYAIEHRLLTATRTLTIKKTEVSPASPGWEIYKKFCKALADERDRFVDLTTGLTVYPSGEGPGSKTATLAPALAASNPEIAKLMQEGAEAVQKHDMTRAEEDFRQAIRIDPKFPKVHIALAQVHCMRGNKEECVRELRIEKENYPEDLSIYQFLGSTLAWMHRDDEALQQYLELLKRDPGNRDAALAVARLLGAQHKDSEAVTELEKAMQAAPESPILELALAEAYLHSKQTEKGVALMKKAMSSDSTPNTLNSAAYELAEANVSLDLAEEYAEKAVHQLEASSSGLESDDSALANTQELSATWDTVGWIFFRKGDFDKARPYLETSWILSQRSVIGDHLAQLYERQGKKTEAMHQYRLALAASSMPGESTADIKDHYKRLTGKEPADSDAPNLRRRGTGPEEVPPREELSRMRSVKLSATSTISGSAIFSVDFMPGKIAAVRYVSGDKSLIPVSAEIKGTKFDLALPDTSPVRVVRRGILMCGIAGCNFTFLLSDFSRTFDLNAEQQK